MATDETLREQRAAAAYKRAINSVEYKTLVAATKALSKRMCVELTREIQRESDTFNCTIVFDVDEFIDGVVFTAKARSYMGAIRWCLAKFRAAVSAVDAALKTDGG